jgi:hypothetical protein
VFENVDVKIIEFVPDITAVTLYTLDVVDVVKIVIPSSAVAAELYPGHFVVILVLDTAVLFL